MTKTNDYVRPYCSRSRTNLAKSVPDKSPTEPVRLKQEINGPRGISCEGEGVSLKSCGRKKDLGHCERKRR
jgi:hypothetical protein